MGSSLSNHGFYLNLCIWKVKCEPLDLQEVQDVPGASVLTQDGKEVDFGHFFPHWKQAGKLQTLARNAKRRAHRKRAGQSGHVRRWRSAARLAG